jgi:hypothetical protein
MSVVEKIPFKLYPLNKTPDNKYSFYQSSPIINFQFQATGARVVDPKSLRLCGRFRILDNTEGNKLPANRFDLAGSNNAAQQNYEKVAYVSDRVGPSSCISSVNIANMRGQLYEQVKSYGRMLSSLKGATASYRDYCSVNQNLWGSFANQNCIANALSSDIPFAMPLRCGFLMEPQPISLANGGLKITLQLANDAQVVYGLNANGFVYELSDLFLSGSYLVLDQPVQPEKGQLIEYHQFYSYLNTLNSGLDHQNLNLNLKEVVSVYSNFTPSTWSSSYAYDGFSTPKIMNQNNVETDLNEIRFNRGATMYPLTFPINERTANNNGAFESMRSRHFLNAIAGYANLTHSTISPVSEALTNYESEQNWIQNAAAAGAGATSVQNVLDTNQDVDRGSVNQWVWAQVTAWAKSGDVEKSGRVWGIGFRPDELLNDSTQDYSQASYNYSLDSGHDGVTPNSVYTYVLAKTQVFSDGQGGIVAAN